MMPPQTNGKTYKYGAASAKAEAQRAAMIQYLVEHPFETQYDAAQHCGFNRNTVSRWMQNDDFTSALRRRCEATFAGLQPAAIAVMQNALKKGSLRAAEYVLNACGYAERAQAEQDNATITININGEGDT